MKIGKLPKNLGIALLLLCVSAGSAFADIAIAGTSVGDFNTENSIVESSYKGLSFTGGEFGPSTSPVVLGSFVFSAPSNLLTTIVTDFVLTLNFWAPGNGTGTFSANVRGLATIGVGAANIKFDPNTERIEYTTSEGTGTFDLTLNDLTVVDPTFGGSGDPVYVIGTINNASFTRVPEPSAIPEFLLSIAGIGFVALFQRRRLQNS